MGGVCSLWAFWGEGAAVAGSGGAAACDSKLKVPSALFCLVAGGGTGGVSFL